jgi:predicted ATPase with chaperone activity
MARRVLRHNVPTVLDRIDLHIEVPAVPYQELRGKDEGQTSAEIRGRVEKARAIQNARGFYNAQIPVRQLRKLCALDDAGERTLEMAVRRMGLSARARPYPEGRSYHRRSRLTRTSHGQTSRGSRAVS